MSINPLPSRGALQTGQDFRRVAIVAVKALVSIGLITFLATRLDYTRLLSYWSAFNGIWMLGAIAVLLLEMSAIAGVRLKLMLAYVDARRPLTTTVQIALCGFFFEQVTIGFVGGDAVRLWLLRQADVPLGRAIAALVLDRACGSASLLLLSLLGAHALLALLDEPLRARIVDTLIVVIAVGAIGVAVTFALMKLLPLSKLTGPWRGLGSRGQAANIIVLAIVFVLAATTHLLNILVFWMLGQSLGLSMTFNQWFIVVPTVLLISMLPISIGGWGVREGAMVVALHGFGVPAEQALLPSILFGLCAAIATLPGGIVWVTGKKTIGEDTGGR
jgi:glycosyltransferase 2 family protein